MIKNDERTILITGATGTVGREVVRLVLASSSSSDHNLIKSRLFIRKIKLKVLRNNNNSNKEVGNCQHRL